MCATKWPAGCSLDENSNVIYGNRRHGLSAGGFCYVSLYKFFGASNNVFRLLCHTFFLGVNNAL